MISISPRSWSASSSRARLLVDLHQFLALLDHLLQQAEHVVLGEPRLALHLRLDVGILDRRIDQTQGRNPALVAGLHCGLEGGVDLVAQHGYGLSRFGARIAVEPAARCDRRSRPSMNETQPAGMQPRASWSEPKATALLVLADGTVLEGFGFGATGQAVGEVCFNTAMTGYQEILTDPSYAGQIITFTFPHIGNVGTNEDDIETVNMAATPGARGVILHTAITRPSNYRATRHLDQWLKARGIIGLCGIDTRALTGLIRVKGMPNAVIAHEPSGQFDLDALQQEAREWPGLVGMDLVPMVTSGQRFTWDETPWEWGKGYGRQERPNSTSSPSTTASSATSCASSPARAAR